MKWTNNLIQYNKTGEVGKCPKCGSEKVEATKHTHGQRCSITFVCNDCGAFEHFDGATQN